LSLEQTLRCAYIKKENEGNLAKSKSNLHRGADNGKPQEAATWKRKNPRTTLFRIFRPHAYLFPIRTRRGMSKVIAYFSGELFRGTLSSHEHTYILRFSRLGSPSMSNLPVRKEKSRKGDEIKENSWSEEWQE